MVEVWSDRPKWYVLCYFFSLKYLGMPKGFLSVFSFVPNAPLRSIMNTWSLDYIAFIVLLLSNNSIFFILNLTFWLLTFISSPFSSSSSLSSSFKSKFSSSFPLSFLALFFPNLLLFFMELKSVYNCFFDKSSLSSSLSELPSLMLSSLLASWGPSFYCIKIYS